MDAERIVLVMYLLKRELPVDVINPIIDGLDVVDYSKFIWPAALPITPDNVYMYNREHGTMFRYANCMSMSWLQQARNWPRRIPITPKNVTAFNAKHGTRFRCGTIHVCPYQDHHDGVVKSLKHVIY
jgi:hypothetical protein